MKSPTRIPNLQSKLSNIKNIYLHLACRHHAKQFYTPSQAFKNFYCHCLEEKKKKQLCRKYVQKISLEYICIYVRALEISEKKKKIATDPAWLRIKRCHEMLQSANLNDHFTENKRKKRKKKEIRKDLRRLTTTCRNIYFIFQYLQFYASFLFQLLLLLLFHYFSRVSRA